MGKTFLPVKIVRITDLNDERIEQAAAVIVEALDSDSVTSAMAGGRPEFRMKIRRAMVTATVIGGLMYVALDESGHVIGTASWYPPGTHIFADDDQKNAGFNEAFKEVSDTLPRLRDWWLTTLLPRHDEVCEKFLATVQDPDGQRFLIDNWHLHSFCVAPKFQGMGIGKQLLAVGESLAKEGNSTICLDTATEELVAMYSKLGYTDRGHEYVEGIDGSPGFVLHVMTKSFGTPTPNFLHVAGNNDGRAISRNDSEACQ